MREHGAIPIHQAQLALHGELGAGNVHKFSAGDFMFDGDQRHQGHAVLHAHELLDVFDGWQLDIHVQRRVVLLERLNDFFAIRTEHGVVAHGGMAPECDPLLLTGVIAGRLGAEADAKAAYGSLTAAPEFEKPVSWAGIDPESFDGLILPGGHAPGMRQYLGSAMLRDKVAAFWQLDRPVGAICHGVLVLARTIDPATGQSVLADRFTTCLPKYMERGAFAISAWKLGRYYRTYPAYVQDEVVAALTNPEQFLRGPMTVSRRGSASDDTPAFCVLDSNYLSARWPGDAYKFAKMFETLLSAVPPKEHP